MTEMFYLLVYASMIKLKWYKNSKNLELILKATATVKYRKKK